MSRIKNKIGRNSPCPCGSGKKYKLCCFPEFDPCRDNTARYFSDDLLKRFGNKSQKIYTNYKERMSETIMKFAEPLQEIYPDEKDAYPVAISAWNAALLPEEKLKELLGDFLNSSSRKHEDKPAVLIRRIFVSLIATKLQDYPDNRRMIIDYEFVNTPEGVQFNVVSTELEE